MNKKNLLLVLSLAVAIILIPALSIAAPIITVPIDKDGILLSANLPQGQKNVMNTLIPPTYGWFEEVCNPSTGYSWHFVPDNSGVYKMVKQFFLRGSIENTVGQPLIGVPGQQIWIFQAIKAGLGVAKFEQFAPGGKTPVRTETVLILVKAVK